MPIDYKNYNPGFRALSLRIRTERAKGRCERCGVPNRAEGYWVDVRDDNDSYPPGLAVRRETYKDRSTKIWRFYTWRQIESTLEKQGYDLLDGVAGYSVGKLKKMSQVVLTVAHLNHDCRDDREENLKALCQWCHLSHDRKDNARRRKFGSRGQYKGQLVLAI